MQYAKLSEINLLQKAHLPSNPSFHPWLCFLIHQEEKEILEMVKLGDK